MKKSVKNNRRISGLLLGTLILVGILLVAGIGFFTANLLSNAGVTPSVGHPINQTAPPTGCLAGQVLRWNGTSNINGGWDCVSAALTKGVAVYTPNVGCSPYFTTANSCSTAICNSQVVYCCIGWIGMNPNCGNFCVSSTYYTCGGSCSAGTSQTCSNTLLGYLVN